MGVSVFVNGVRSHDGKLGEMADLKVLCDSNEMSYPPELVKYFEGSDALDMRERSDVIKAATEVSLRYDLRNIKGLTNGDVDYGNGMIIDLSKLPDDIKKLRIYMS